MSKNRRWVGGSVADCFARDASSLGTLGEAKPLSRCEGKHSSEEGEEARGKGDDRLQRCHQGHLCLHKTPWPPHSAELRNSAECWTCWERKTRRMRQSKQLSRRQRPRRKNVPSPSRSRTRSCFMWSEAEARRPDPTGHREGEISTISSPCSAGKQEALLADGERRLVTRTRNCCRFRRPGRVRPVARNHRQSTQGAHEVACLVRSASHRARRRRRHGGGPSEIQGGTDNPNGHHRRSWTELRHRDTRCGLRGTRVGVKSRSPIECEAMTHRISWSRRMILRSRPATEWDTDSGALSVGDRVFRRGPHDLHRCGKIRWHPCASWLDNHCTTLSKTIATEVWTSCHPKDPAR